MVGFAGALRRSELVAVEVGDVAPVAEGLILTKRRSKTDQEAAGDLLGIPYGSNPSTCPVRAVDAWCQRPGSATGPCSVPSTVTAA